MTIKPHIGAVEAPCKYVMYVTTATRYVMLWQWQSRDRKPRPFRL